MGRNSKKEGINVSTELIHFAIRQKLTQGCKATIAVAVIQSLSHVQYFANPWIQHARLSCPSLSPGVPSTSCPLSQRCHPTIWSPAATFSFAFNFFQRQSLFQWVTSSHQVAKVLELQLQHQLQSFQWIFRVDFFRIDWYNLFAVQGTVKSLLQHYSSKHQFLGVQPSLWFNSHIHT